MDIPADKQEPQQSLAIESILNDIKKLLLELNLHKDDKIDKSSANKKEIIDRFLAIQGAISGFRKFNAELFEKVGITTKELSRSANEIPKGSEAERLMAMSNQLKIEVLLSYADFFRKAHEKSKTSPMFQEGDLSNKASRQKAVKQKFKTMTHRSKWKKM